MYTARLSSLGQTTGRRAILEEAITDVMGMARFGLVPEEAITYVLRMARYQPFPTGTWTVSPTAFEQRVMEIMLRANEARPAGTASFQADEVRAALIERGYKPGTLPIVSPAPRAGDGVQDNRVSLPSPTLFPPVAPVRTAPYVPLVKPEPIAPTFFPPSPASREPGPVMLPVVVPRSPVFPGIPMPKEKGNAFLWIAGLLALYVLGKAEGNPHRQAVRSRRKKPVSGISTLGGIGGATANCGLWQEVEGGPKGGLLWRCLKYAPACMPGFRCVSPERLPARKKKQIRVCAKLKKVKPTSPRFMVASISRCARFLRVCPDGACLDEPFDKPPPSPGHGANVKSMIRDLAKQMAEERNELEETAGKALGREIVDRGGIRSYRKGREREEYREVPIFMRKKTGLPLDEMASEMGYETDQELLEAISRAYPATAKTKRRYTAQDFMLEAEGRVWYNIDAGFGSGLGQNLFPGLRRELALEVEDPATSDDPLEIHLQRRGWKLKRVSELQESMAEKAVPDMFTGKTKPLTQAEAELQDEIQEFFAKSRAYRESLAAKYARPLSASQTYTETVEQRRGQWKKDPLSVLYHDWNVLLARGKYVTDKREMAKVKKIEARIRQMEKARSLGAVQLEMFDREKLRQHWFFIPKRHRLAQHVTEAEKNRNQDFYLKAETQGSGKLYSVPGKSKAEALKRLNEELDKAREYRYKWGGSRNPHEPSYYAFSRQMGYRIVPFTEAQAEQTARDMKAAKHAKPIPLSGIRSGLGTVNALQALNALYSLSKMAGGS